MSMYHGNGGYGETVNLTSPSRELQIPLSLADLERSVDRLMKVSEELSLRLSRVCRPEAPVNDMTAKEAVPHIPQAEFVQVLFGNSARVRSVSEKLEALLSRLEL